MYIKCSYCGNYFVCSQKICDSIREEDQVKVMSCSCIKCHNEYKKKASIDYMTIDYFTCSATVTKITDYKTLIALTL